MSNKLYIPVASNNLSHYFLGGIIIPVKYIENRIPDIQDYDKDSILLSRYKFTHNSNCAIEVIINETEEVVEKISDNFFLLNSPLPISRIKNIFFRNNDQKVLTIFNIQNGSAFLPENLVQLSDEDEMPFSQFEEFKSAQRKVDFQSQIKRFDRLMGGISVMQIAREHYQNYPTHFVVTLGNINAHFNSNLVNQGIRINNKFEFAFNEGVKYRDLHETIFSETSLETVQTFAKKEGINIETKNGVIQLDRIPEGKQTYYVAILENFGYGKRKQLDSFISELVSGNLDEKRKEGIAFFFGLNKGYKAFRNKYKTANFEVDIKFRLDSQFDYYIIESIFQYVFNNKNDIASFDYIDNWCNKASHAKLNVSNYKTYKILDKCIIYKKKQDFFEDYYQSFSQARNKVYFAITEKIKSILPGFISLDIEKATEYFIVQLNKPLKDFATDIISSMQETIDLQENCINNLESSMQEKNNENEELKNAISELKQKNTELSQQLIGYGKSDSLNKETVYDSNLGNENIINELRSDDFEQIISSKLDIAHQEESLDDSKSSHSSELTTSAESKETFNEDDSQNSDTSNESNGENSLVNQSPKIFESVGSLFIEEMDDDYQKNLRYKELMSFSLDKLRNIAKDMKIKSPSKYNKDELVFQIIKIEYMQ
jgi:hypothetical protein